MSIGDYIDALIDGMFNVLTFWNTIAMAIIAIGVAFSKWWLNHYDSRRATIYAKNTIFGAICFFIVVFIVISPSIDNSELWNLLGMLIWLVFFGVLGLYFAAIFTVKKNFTSDVFKLRMAAVLKYYVDQLERSAAASASQKTVEEKVLKSLGEVLEENKEQAKMYIGLL